MINKNNCFHNALHINNDIDLSKEIICFGCNSENISGSIILDLNQELKNYKISMLSEAELSLSVSALNLYRSLPSDFFNNSKINSIFLIDSLNKVREGTAQMIPYNIVKDENEDMKVELLVINRSDISLCMPILPIKLKDVNGNIVAADIFNANINVDKQQISKLEIIIPKEKIKAADYDISKFDITFEAS